jgi:hypothetical protein
VEIEEEIMKRFGWVAVFGLFVAALFVPGAVHAQAVATISGTVVDSSGASVSGAQVTAHNEGTSQDRVVNTDDQGHYAIPLLPIGKYTLEVSAAGFRKVQNTGVSLEVGQSLTQDFKLDLASVSEQVQVTAEAPQVQVERTNAEIAQEIHTDQVSELPLNGRDFAQLAFLGSGTVRQQRPGNFLNSGGTSEVSFRGSVALSSQGMRENANDWLYDGIDNNELTAGGVGYLPSIDAINEFKVMTYNFSAQYGSRAGSTVLVSSKSGSNSLHGTAFEFLRNDVLDSRNYFDGAKKGKYIQNEYGASLGGPIKKDNTFFFTDFQINSIRQGLTILNTVPTALERQGIFTESFNGVATPAIFNPFVAGRPQFTNNTIPSGMISPIASTLINMLPLPNIPNSISNNYRSNPVKTLDDAQWDIRLDHNFSSNDHIFARFSWDNANQTLPDGLPGFGSPSAFNSNQAFTTHSRNIALSETHVFSPNLINQFTIGYNRDFNYITSFGYGSNESAKLGIPGANLGNIETSSLTTFVITGFAGFGDRGFSPFQGGTNVYHYLDSLNWVHGQHSFTFGGEFRAMQENTLGDTSFAGLFTFNTLYTANSSLNFGNSIASFLLGLPTNESRTDEFNGYKRGRRWKETRGFVEDNWTVNKQLSLQLGLAYAVTTPVSEAHDRFSNLDFVTQKIYVGGHIGVQTDWTNVEPRIGFAWSPGVFGNTVVRGGYGIYHDIGATGGATGPYENPPYANGFLYTSDNGNPNIPPNSLHLLANGFPPNNPVDPNSYPGTWHSIATNFQQGLVQQWNLDIQHEFPSSVLFTIAYTGTHGTRLSQKNVDLNSSPPNPAGADLASSRPFPKWGQILETYSGGWLGYQSMQLKAEKRTTKGLYVLAAYTYSKALSNGLRQEITNDPGVNYFPYLPTPNADKGLASTDLRNNFTVSFLYNLPVGKGQMFGKDLHGPAQVILGGWALNGIAVLHSGFALGETVSSNKSGFVPGNRPNIKAGCNPNLANPTPKEWFDISCFTLPLTGQFGNAPRTYLYGPGQANLDLSLYKSADITEKLNVQFRSEFFNILNHTQFSTPLVAAGATTFGTITSTVNSSRQIQFALKLRF